MTSATAAVVLNWNGRERTERAVRSLLALERPPSVIVVDNGSRDRTEPSLLEAQFPRARVVRLARNVGFARAVNEGIRIALHDGARFILLFNNDAWLETKSDVVERLEAALIADPRLAAAGPAIANVDGSVQSLGYRYSLWFPLARPCRPHRDPPRFLSGSCLLVRAEAFAELGGLDPDYFLYGDDVDFALRAERLGYRFALVGEERVYHERAVSNGVYSPNYAYTALRSNLIVVRKHGAFYQIPTAAATLFAASVALAILGVWNGFAGTPAAIVRAWIDFARGRWGGYDGSRLEPVSRPSASDAARVA